MKHALFQIIDGGIHVGQTLGIAGLHVLYDLVIVQTLVAAEVDVPAVSGTLTRLYRPYPLVVSVGEPVGLTQPVDGGGRRQQPLQLQDQI